VREDGATPFMVHAMQMDVSFDTPGIGSGIPFPMYIPDDAQILCLIAKVVTAFDDTGTDTLTVGTNSSSFDNIAGSGDIDEATTGTDVVWTGADLDTSSGPLLPYVKYAGGNSDAAAGRAILTLLYIPKIDR
jgi:hypothetical protein